MDQKDTQAFGAAKVPSYSNYCNVELNEPPVLTRSWFHLGAYLQNKKILDHYRHEYWYNNPALTRASHEIQEEEYLLPHALFIGAFDNQGIAGGVPRL